MLPNDDILQRTARMPVFDQCVWTADSSLVVVLCHLFMFQSRMLRQPPQGQACRGSSNTHHLRELKMSNFS